jgi:hypothetical protein
MLEKEGMKYHRIGKHWGRNEGMKILGTLIRVAQLYNFSLGKRIDLALSHGSRGLVLASYMRRIPSITMFDYEYVDTKIFTVFSSRLLVPGAIHDILKGRTGRARKLLAYDGFKEMIYLHGYHPSAGILHELGIDPEKKVIVIRPPARLAHYHNPKSEIMCDKILDHFLHFRDIQIVLLVRTPEERSWYLSKDIPARLFIPQLPVNALDLMYFSDLVISGGGTMNREAALMNVPTISIFAGTKGAIDTILEKQNRLRFISDPSEIDTIEVAKRGKLPETVEFEGEPLSERVVDRILLESRSLQA